MASISGTQNAAVAKAYPFGQLERLVDVGGALLATFRATDPSVPVLVLEGRDAVLRSGLLEARSFVVSVGCGRSVNRWTSRTITNTTAATMMKLNVSVMSWPYLMTGMPLALASASERGAGRE